MLRESEFPELMKTYKTLRKEQIEFPEKTVTVKTFIDQIPGNKIENDDIQNVSSTDDTCQKSTTKIQSKRTLIWRGK